jgi:hypothetical protein
MVVLEIQDYEKEKNKLIIWMVNEDEKKKYEKSINKELSIIKKTKKENPEKESFIRMFNGMLKVLEPIVIVDECDLKKAIDLYTKMEDLSKRYRIW